MKIKFSAPVVLILSVFFAAGCSSEPATTATSPDGVELHFSNRGKGTPAIVLVHGWTNNRTIWDAQVDYLADKYQVIALDLAGHGESGNNRTSWKMKAFGQDIAAVVDAASLKEVVLVGFSMGGPAVVEAAPLLGDRLKGVIFVETIQDPEAFTPPPVVHLMDSMMMDLISNPSPEKLVQLGFFRNNPEQSMEKVNAMLDHDRTGWEDCLLETLRWNNEDCATALGKIDVPVMAINGENVPTNEEALKKIIPSFEVTYIPNSGHVVMWDATEAFNKALDNTIRKIMEM